MTWNEDEDVPTRVEQEKSPAAELDALDWEEDVETRVTRRAPGEDELARARSSSPPPMPGGGPPPPAAGAPMPAASAPPIPAPSGVMPTARPSARTLVGTGPSRRGEVSGASGPPSAAPTRVGPVIPAPSPSITALSPPPAPVDLGTTLQDARPPEMDLGRTAPEAPPGLLSRPSSDRISAPPPSRRSGPPPLPRAAGSRPSGPPSIRPSTPGTLAGGALPRATPPPMMRRSAPTPVPSAANSSPTLREAPSAALARATASAGTSTEEMPTARIPPASESLPEPATVRRLPSVSAPPPRPRSAAPPSPRPEAGLALPPARMPPVAPVSPTAGAFTLGADFRGEHAPELGGSTPEPTDATTVPQVTTRIELHREVSPRSDGAFRPPPPPPPFQPMVMGDVAIGPGAPAPVPFLSSPPRIPEGLAEGPMAYGQPVVLPSLVPFEPVTEPSGWSKIAALLGALSLVISIGLGAYLLWPRTGQLRVEIADQAGPMGRVEVFVDGQKRCETTPCVVADLVPGGHHVEVGVGDAPRVAVSGEVVAGRERMLRVPLARTAIVKAAGTQPGVKVFVDGKDLGPLPTLVKDVTPGQHRLVFDGGDRYEPLEETIEAVAGQTVDMGNVVLPVKKGLVTVHLDTPGATVLLVAEGERTQKILPGPWPMTLDVQAAQGWKLIARKAGFRELTEPLTFADGNAERTIHVALQDGSSAPAAAAPVAAAPGPARVRAPPRRPQPRCRPPRARHRARRGR
ncbi:MAG: PEGA domain-containing protein [Polyangiaceae bacterium]